MPRRKTHEEFVAEVKALVGNEFTVLSEYRGREKEVLIKCNTCGCSYERKANSFLVRRACNNCAKKSRPEVKLKNAKRKFMEFFESNRSAEYELLSEYQGSKNKILVKHKKCGRIYEVGASSFLSGTGCFDCAVRERANRKRYSQEEAESIVFMSSGGDCRLVGKYKGMVVKTDVLCARCGHIWQPAPSSIQQGHKCPLCISSRGEKRISQFLVNNDLVYETQFKFERCRNRKELPFDFVVLKQTTEYIAIEFDGEQHFKVVNFGGRCYKRAEKEFLKRVENDRIKDKYCADNGIPLIRIPYWEFDNIDAILTQKLLPLLTDNAKSTQQKAS